MWASYATLVEGGVRTKHRIHANLCNIVFSNFCFISNWNNVESTKLGCFQLFILKLSFDLPASRVLQVILNIAPLAGQVRLSKVSNKCNGLDEIRAGPLGRLSLPSIKSWIRPDTPIWKLALSQSCSPRIKDGQKRVKPLLLQYEILEKLVT